MTPFRLRLLLLCVFPLASFAQPEVPPLERVLVPLLVEDTPGRNGSVWRTELTVSNRGTDPVVFAEAIPYCVLPGCGLLYLEPGEVRTEQPGRRANPGTIFVVERDGADQVQFFLRTWDLTRDTSWGTMIPVVREDDLLTSPVELVSVPTRPEFRQAIRVYEVPPTNANAVRITVLAPPPLDTVLASVDLDLRFGTDRALEPRWPARPSYAAILDLVGMFPQLQAHETVRVRVDPLAPDMAYWAFVTITHNDTHHVTVIAPQ